MKKIITMVYLGIFVLLGICLCYPPVSTVDIPMLSGNTTENIAPKAGPYKCIRVIDGDTLVISIDEVETRVRLIGIDAPESVHPEKEKNTADGAAASEYIKNLLEGKEVYLEYDKERRDWHNRTLAYIYYNDEMVNKKLLEEGYAEIMTIPPNIAYENYLQE